MRTQAPRHWRVQGDGGGCAGEATRVRVADSARQGASRSVAATPGAACRACCVLCPGTKGSVSILYIRHTAVTCRCRVQVATQAPPCIPDRCSSLHKDQSVQSIHVLHRNFFLLQTSDRCCQWKGSGATPCRQPPVERRAMWSRDSDCTSVSASLALHDNRLC